MQTVCCLYIQLLTLVLNSRRTQIGLYLFTCKGAAHRQRQALLISIHGCNKVARLYARNQRRKKRLRTALECHSIDATCRIDIISE